MSCHRACKDCWKNYLTHKIKVRKFEIQCLGKDCEIVLNEEAILSFLQENIDTIELYHKVGLEDFVAVNRFLKWCPGINCGRVVKVSE
ncbi:Protein CBG26170 [Caenorhabditis briggsae]|uniref:Protein CBG26170 n=1 Tax=Caenorhabditis briggsae TaxID=6238 RepID=B6ILA6_CAEBR|nr:Protein CBG26170 [Caenorhabditis briggsae]CAS00686.1 Protein CBG26170 [Caenorhabditis briggsae]